MIPVMII
jgi:hypothetical protein